MLYEFCRLFILFIVYSFIGYVSELIYCSIQFKKIVLNRGFFIGPYLPIYGVCCIMMTFFLEKYNNDLVALFIMSIVLCSITEFVTSYILEKIYKVRWWDYSNMKFNFEGRICLLNSCLFGVGGVALIHFINPTVYPILDMLPKTLLIIIGLILVVIFLTDLSISVKTLHEIKIQSDEYSDHDATEEIKFLVRKNISKGSFLITRLLNAFPSIGGKNKMKLISLKKFTNEIRKKIKQNSKAKNKIFNKDKK